MKAIVIRGGSHIIEAVRDELVAEILVDVGKGSPSKPLLQGVLRVVDDQSPELGQGVSPSFAPFLGPPKHVLH